MLFGFRQNAQPLITVAQIIVHLGIFRVDFDATKICFNGFIVPVYQAASIPESLRVAPVILGAIDSFFGILVSLHRAVQLQ